MDKDHSVSPEIIAWLDNAIDAYYCQRVHTFLNQVGHQSSTKLLSEWNQLLQEMFGNDESKKHETVRSILQDDQVNPSAKTWLREIEKNSSYVS
jgi:hypothetical protein